MVYALLSSLMLDPRVKQTPSSFSHIHKIHRRTHFTNAKTLSTLGCGTRPVSIGSRRWRADCTEHTGVISVFVHVRFAFGWGKRFRSLNVIRNCSICCRTLREPTMPICIGFFRKPCLKIIFFYFLEIDRHLMLNYYNTCLE